MMVGSPEPSGSSTFPEKVNFALRELGFLSKADGLGEPEMLISSDLKDRSVLSSENSTFVASLSTDNEVMSVEVSKGQSLSVLVGTVAQDFVCSLTF